MFSLKNKLEHNLKYALDNKFYKTYRVNILCKNMQDNIEKKIKAYKGSVIHSIQSVNIISALVPANALERLIEYPEVEYIAKDSYAHLCGNSVLSSNGISFQEKYKLTGKGIGVAIIDSGVYPHGDLTTPSNKVKSFLDLVNNYRYPYDDNGHGTFISGILCGNGNLSKGMYRGIAENSSLHCVKAFNSSGKAYISSILFAIDSLLNTSTEYNLKVICMPFEIFDNNEYVLEAFSKLFSHCIKKGIVPVVASGSNENTECSILGIATLPNCITVGGIDTRTTYTPYKYSSYGPCGKYDKPDLVAACVDVCSLNTNINFIPEKNGIKLFPHILDKPYVTYTGTSCATAYISGICALLFENNSELTFKDILSLLKVSCTLLNIPRAAQGSGIINLHKLLP